MKSLQCNLNINNCVSETYKHMWCKDSPHTASTHWLVLAFVQRACGHIISQVSYTTPVKAGIKEGQFRSQRAKNQTRAHFFNFFFFFHYINPKWKEKEIVTINKQINWLPPSKISNHARDSLLIIMGKEISVPSVTRHCINQTTTLVQCQKKETLPHCHTLWANPLCRPIEVWAYKVMESH